MLYLYKNAVEGEKNCRYFQEKGSRFLFFHEDEKAGNQH